MCGCSLSLFYPTENFLVVSRQSLSQCCWMFAPPAPVAGVFAVPSAFSHEPASAEARVGSLQRGKALVERSGGRFLAQYVRRHAPFTFLRLAGGA